MQLPFTTEQFFDLLEAYNEAMWPALVVMWMASLVGSILLFSSPRPSDRWISGLLAAHWTWSALAYHVTFFTQINTAAWVFAALFLLQGALFFWWGVVRGRLSFAPRRSAWAPVAWVLIAYSLLYPGINALQHLSISRIPAFGVPCPTMIFTAGVLMLATPRSWRVSIIPVTWSFIGGSAAVLLGVRADYALPIAGIGLAVFSLQRQKEVTTARRSCVAHGPSRGGARESSQRRENLRAARPKSSESQPAHARPLWHFPCADEVQSEAPHVDIPHVAPRDRAHDDARGSG
jgi:hypothetical protein